MLKPQTIIILFIITIISVSWKLVALENSKGVIASVDGIAITFDNLCKTNNMDFHVKDFNNDDEVIKILAKKMQIIIRDTTFDNYNIKFTQTEIQNEWDKTIDKDERIKALINLQKRSKLILKALGMVNEEKQNKEVVFDKYLKEHNISHMKWEKYLQDYSSKENRKTLEKQLELTVDDMIKPNNGFVLIMKSNKLNQVIDEEMKNVSPLYEEFYQSKAEDKSKKIIEGAMKNYYLEYKRNIWWRNKVKEMDIEIIEEKYKRALDMLFPDK